MNWASCLFASLAGALITVQAGSNSQLKKSLGEPMPAVMINYVIGFCVVAAYSAVRHAPMVSLDKAGQGPLVGVVRRNVGLGLRRGSRPVGQQARSGPSDRPRRHRPAYLLRASRSFWMGRIRSPSGWVGEDRRLRSYVGRFDAHRKVLKPARV